MPTSTRTPLCHHQQEMHTECHCLIWLDLCPCTSTGNVSTSQKTFSTSASDRTSQKNLTSLTTKEWKSSTQLAAPSTRLKKSIARWNRSFSIAQTKNIGFRSTLMEWMPKSLSPLAQMSITASLLTSVTNCLKNGSPGLWEWISQKSTSCWLKVPSAKRTSRLSVKFSNF